MLISLSENHKKFIFIANTKAASTSIENMLLKYSHINIIRPPTLKHMSYSMLAKKFNFLFYSSNKFKLENFYKFGVYRDPLDWTISWFNYRSRPAISDPKDPLYKNYLGNTTFENFVNFLDREEFIKPQKYKFIDKHSNNAMDFLIDYSDLEQELKYVVQALGIEDLEVKLPYANKSSNIRIKKEDVKEATIEKIKDFFHEDYTFFENVKNSRKRIA